MVRFPTSPDELSDELPDELSDELPHTPPPQIAPPAEGLSSPTPVHGLARLERLGDEIAEMSAHLEAGEYLLLVRIAEFDRCFREEGERLGFPTTAHWLSSRIGIGRGPRGRKVRVARALEDLPQNSEALCRTEISYSKARALTRVANRENESRLLEFLREGTAAQVEKVVRAWRRVDRTEEEWSAGPALREKLQQARCGLSLFADVDGTWVIRGRLDAEVGANAGFTTRWASPRRRVRGWPATATGW